MARLNRVDLPTGSSLVKGTVFSMLGQGLPLVVAVACLPFVVKGLGAERFGLLMLSAGRFSCEEQRFAHVLRFEVRIEGEDSLDRLAVGQHQSGGYASVRIGAGFRPA